jgi:asparagine synthase (glutamine-hydrolysing)
MFAGARLAHAPIASIGGRPEELSSFWASMCGIAGVLWRNGRLAAQDQLWSMANIQRHRGPDDAGVWTDGCVGFGHRRLSIIDLSAGGHQPMTTADGLLTITYNGEVYNYKELRQQLADLGHAFVSQSDSEVILHAYQEWGVACVSRFNGMWAFGIWDRARNRLFLSRDRLGKKPLHYLDRSDCFAFSSEIKGLLVAFPEERRADYSFLYHVLTTSRVADGDESGFVRIRSLLPAHSMLVDRSGSRTWRYWDFDPERAAASYDYARPSDTLRELLQDAVRLRLRSDVPIGTCLSGGLDSSSVVALASSQSERPMNAFSVVYEDAGYDESFYAGLVAERFNCTPHVIRPDGSDWLDVAQRLTWHQEVPSTGPSVYSQWAVMREASPYVRVLLDGQGGDELLGGYHYFFVAYLLGRVQGMVRRGRLVDLPTLVGEVRAITELTGMSLASALPRYVARRLRWGLRHRTPRLSTRAAGTSAALWAEACRRPIVRAQPRRFADGLSDTLYYSTTMDSLPSLLHWEDRNSMAFSIEARLPFLDYRLVEFCLGLAPEERISGSITKRVLREAMAAILPSEIVQRRSKMGFPTPFAAWLRDKALDDARELLLSQSLRERDVLDGRVVEHKLDEHARGERDHSLHIWRWLTLELWFRQFIDPSPAAFGALAVD